MPLEVRLLGDAEIRGPEGRIDISARKARGLFFHLAERSGRPQQRDPLARLLWGEISSDEHARRSLRQALTVLRRELPAGTLVASREHVALDPGEVDVDVRRFERLAGSAELEALRAAVGLYRGDFLEGFVSGSDLFDDWVASTRQRLREHAIGVLGRLLSLQRETGDLEGATATAIRCLSLDPLREDLHRTLMHTYVEQGRLGDALEQFEQCRRLLQRELGVAPSAATRELLEQLRSRARQGHGRTLAASSAEPAVLHLRLVAVLAVHLHELEAHEPEGPRERPSEWFAPITRAILDQAGEVLRQTPHSLLAVFGADATRGTEPLRALRAAREGLASEPLARGLGMGVSYGEVMVTRGAGQRDVVGDALARAAQLAAQAEGGTALASDSLQRAARDRPGAAVAFEPTRLRSGERSWGVRFVPGPAQTALPFVGRMRELSLLRAVLDSCRQQARGETVLIRGEAGIGKTRLLGRLLELAAADGYDVHHVCATDFGPRWQRDIVAALTRSALRCGSLEREAVAARVLHFFGELEGQQALALLAGLRDEGLPASSDARERQAKQVRRQQLWQKLWQERIAVGPTLVAIEDLHWVDAADRVFLAELGALASTGPLLLVATSRPEAREHADWQGALRGRPVTTLDVGPLSELEARDLASLLGAASAERIEDAIARSEGHPLFLEQLLRAEPGAALPESVQAVVQARLDVLAPADAEALRAASVLGQQVEPVALEGLLGRAVTLERLIGAGLLRSSGAHACFAHALVRDAVYATLLQSVRRDLHRRAAELMAGGDLLLSAEHWERAEDPRAGRAFLEAARAAAASDRLREAVQSCERGLEWATDIDTRFELSLARAQLLRRSADPDRAEQAAREAIALAANQTQRARAWLSLGEALRGTLRDDGALEALAMAEQLTPPLDHENRSHIHYLRGSVLFPRALGAESLHCHLQALDHARRAGSALAQARALSGIGDAYYTQGKLLTAREHFEQCIALSEREGLGRLAAMNGIMISIVDIYQLEFEKAEQQMRATALEANRKLDLGTEALAWSSLVLLPTLEGIRAEQDYERCIEVCERAGRGRLAIATRAWLIEARAAPSTPSQRTAALDAIYERCVGSEQTFCGLPVLSVMLRLATGPERRELLYDEADRLLDRGAFVGHGFFIFMRAALLDCIERGDLDRARHYAAKLDGYNPEERMTWATFFCSWASALIAWKSGARDATDRAALIDARDWARRVRLTREAECCEQAMSQPAGGGQSPRRSP